MLLVDIAHFSIRLADRGASLIVKLGRGRVTGYKCESDKCTILQGWVFMFRREFISKVGAGVFGF